MGEVGRGGVVDVVGEHRPDLPGVFVRNDHQRLAERQPRIERADPALLGRGLIEGAGLGALQAAAGALDQQGAQVGVAAAADAAQPRMPAAGVLGGYQAQLRRHLPAIPELARLGHRGHGGIGGDRAHTDQVARPLAAHILARVVGDACAVRCALHASTASRRRAQ